MPIEPLNFLYLSLSVGVIILVILLAVNLLYLIPIMRNASKISSLIRHTTDAANKFVLKPIGLATHFIDKIAPLVERAIEKHQKKLMKK